jgi:hypothetical protein
MPRPVGEDLSVTTVFDTRQLPDDAGLAWITVALTVDSASLEARVIEV